MAELAHEASGQTSSELAGIALQQAKGTASSDKGKLRVFISYSRDDLDFADQLDAALTLYGFECLIDRHGISGGEDWKRRLGNLISEADTVVFVLSPSSALSEICAWEVEESARLNKRILPIICRALEGANPPPRLRDLNYIYFYKELKDPDSGFGTGLVSLVAALNTDFDWLREHTRYLQRAIEWDKGARPANRLLSGSDILDAKAWVARRPKGAPEPTALHLDFIRASEEEAETRLSEQRKQLEAMAAAQAERETALQEREEALKQAADAQRKRVRIRNIALVVVSILGVFAGSLGWLANQQRIKAEEQREQANIILSRTATIILNLYAQMDIETKKEVFAVLQTGAVGGHVDSMMRLGATYATGFGVAQDYAKAREWYEKAAAKGEATAMTNLGGLYAKGQGVAQDYAKARWWYEKAADKDVARAMTKLGGLYENGQGVAQDYAKARWWYEKAADKDDVSAMTNLGWLYKNGQGVAQDYAKARWWYEKAADKDDASAMTNLGWLYENGQGVAQDYGAARWWYERAAAKDDASAMNLLGGLYANGQGVAQDYAKAREWVEKAADKDDASAMTNLGGLYENGQGVAQDYGKARWWYEKAAAKGNTDAKAYLEKLPIREAAEAGRYAEALQLQETLAAKVEAEETKRDGKPGEQTAGELKTLAWYALFAKEFTKALSVADRAHILLPENLTIESNRAHALMFLGRGEESRKLYLAYKGKSFEDDSRLWERVIVDDYAEFRKAGLTHPMMAEIENELGVSSDGNSDIGQR